MLKVTKPSVEKRKQQGPAAALQEDMPEIITGNEEAPVQVKNCIGCGFIYTREEFERRADCGFCGRPMTSKNRKENRRRKEEGEDEQGLIKAEALRQRLVAYDRQSSARTKINDDDQG